MGYSNENILRAFREEGNPLLDEIYNAFKGPVISILLQNAISREEAEDIFIESFQVIYEKCRNPEFTFTHSFQNLLYDIAQKRMLNLLRKKNREQRVTNQLLNVPEDNSYSKAIETVETLNAVMECVEKLSTKRREILSLYYEGDCTWSEVAAIINSKSEGAARQSGYKCIELIRKCMKKKGFKLPKNK